MTASSRASGLRAARPEEAELLSDLAIRSKAVWAYPPDQMAAFRAELTLSPEGLASRSACLMEVAGRVVGFYTLKRLADNEVELDHLFVDPQELRRRHGTRLFEHALMTARNQGYRRMVIQSDPHTAGFYERVGAMRLGDVPSSIPGRTLPLFHVNLADGPMSQRADRVWQERQLATRFVEGVRGGIPLAAEQLDVIVRVIDAADLSLARFLDLGCGDGILGRTLLERYPGSRGVFLDFSDAMLAAARSECESDSRRCTLVHADFASPDWTASVLDKAPFDLIVSGFSIHHQPDQRKRELYAELFDLLRPGGLVLNLEHVASRAEWGKQAFDELMIDALWAFHRQQDPSRTREDVAEEYVHRPDKAANILAPVEDQCQWLRKIGFDDVDCFFKVFELALFGGTKPVPVSQEQSRTSG